MTKKLILGLMQAHWPHYPKQFKGKLTNQTGVNDEKTIFGSNFGPFGRNLGPKNFIGGFYLHQMLNIITSYHCMKFQGKRMIQTQENGEKPDFGPDLGPPIRPKIGPPKLLQYFHVSCDFVCKDVLIRLIARSPIPIIVYTKPKVSRMWCFRIICRN